MNPPNIIISTYNNPRMEPPSAGLETADSVWGIGRPNPFGFQPNPIRTELLGALNVPARGSPTTTHAILAKVSACLKEIEQAEEDMNVLSRSK